MYSKPTNQYPRSRNASKHHRNTNLLRSILSNLIEAVATIFQPLPLLYCLISMSMFYQVVGAVKCPKIKKHAGIKLRPLARAKEPFTANDMIIYSCESADFTQTLKCLDEGRWSEEPYCPDPVNFTCPDIGNIPHGTHNATGPPYKVGVVLAFKCDNEFLPTAPPVSQSTVSALQSSATTSSAQSITTLSPGSSLETPSQIFQNLSTDSETTSLRYNLTGHRLLKCLPSSKWNHPVPSCTPIITEPPSNLSFVLASAALILIPILIIITMFHLFIRWRKRQQQRERWKQYFTDYKYRHSKTSITFGSRPNPATTIPVTDL